MNLSGLEVARNELRVVIVGTGHHARTIWDMLVNVLGVEVVGFTDPDPALAGRPLCGVEVLGGDEIISELQVGGRIDGAVMGIGNRSMSVRGRVYRHLTEAGIRFLSVIHSTAIVSSTARLGQGVVIFAGAVVNSFARLGDNVVINTGAIVEHDCIVGDHSYISSGATLPGNVRVGEGAFVGAAGIVIPEIQVGRWTTVGAGAVVIRDVPDGWKVVGVPARRIE